MEIIDRRVKLGNILKPYLKDTVQQVILVQRPEVILNNLSAPVSRKIYNSVIKCNDIVGFFAHLDERQAKRSVSRIAAPQIVQYSETMSAPMIQLFKRLELDGKIADSLETQQK